MTAFERFADRKTREAVAARIEQVSTTCERPDGTRFCGIGNTWTRLHYGGDFDLVIPGPDETALSLVFVQSKSGDTGGNPGDLGGGPTDTHLIYEGLSRVAADAVLAGAGTVTSQSFFSVWHPELVALRHALNLPRHPAQVVVSGRGRVNPEALLFHVPHVPVYLLASEEAMSDRGTWLRARPWIRHIPLNGNDVRVAIDLLRVQEGIRRISAVGGRFTATRLVDGGLAHDLFLTTGAKAGGEAHTPWYAGHMQPALDVSTKKQWLEDGSPVVFEHVVIRHHFSE